MVISVTYGSMNGDSKKVKKSGGLINRIFGGSTWSLSSSSHAQSVSVNPSSVIERRSLHDGPSFRKSFDSETLSKDYIEKEVKFIGTITDIQPEFNPNDRSKLLSLLDEKKKLGTLTFQFSRLDDVIISFSVYNLKVLWRDGENLIHRIPLNQIFSVGYVYDENRYYYFVKFGSPANDTVCNLALFQCEDKAHAEEMCLIMQQLFQLAYTSSTMDFFDKSIQDGLNTLNKFNSYSTDDSSDKRETITFYAQPEKNISTDCSFDNSSVCNNSGNKLKTSGASTLPSANRQRPLYRRDANGEAGSFLSTSTRSSSSSRITRRSGSSSGSLSTNNSTRLNLQLHEYILVLRERLNSDELRQFAEYLHYFRTGTVPINIFSQQLLDIYTEERKFLLLGMRHFIPDTKDRIYFENFLQQNDVDSKSNDVIKLNQCANGLPENTSSSTTTLTNCTPSNNPSDVHDNNSNSCRLSFESDDKLKGTNTDSGFSIAKQPPCNEIYHNSLLSPSISEISSSIPSKISPTGFQSSTLPTMSKMRSKNNDGNFEKEKKSLFGFKNLKKNSTTSLSLSDISATSPVHL